MVSGRYGRDAMKPRFSTEAGAPPFQTRLFLPNNCPAVARQVDGKQHSDKATAQASACLQALRLLHQVGGAPLSLSLFGLPTRHGRIVAPLDLCCLSNCHLQELLLTKPMPWPIHSMLVAPWRAFQPVNWWLILPAVWHGKCRWVA